METFVHHYAQGQQDLGRSEALLDADDAAKEYKSIKHIKGLTKHMLGCAWEPGFYRWTESTLWLDDVEVLCKL